MLNRLPESLLQARRMASPTAMIHVVDRGQRIDRLPDSPVPIMGPRRSIGWVVAVVVICLALLFGPVAGLGAIASGESFPVPWQALLPLAILALLFGLLMAIGIFRGLKAKPGRDAFRRVYATQRHSVPNGPGQIVDIRISASDSARISYFVASVSSRHGDVIAMYEPRIARLLVHEAPEPGDPVHVWAFPDGWYIVQVSQDRSARAASASGVSVDGGARPVASPGVVTSSGPGPVMPAGTVVEQLTQLAQLRDQGVVTQQEFEQAKRRILNS